jgi:norsolorinic acid ketoreductase
LRTLSKEAHDTDANYWISYCSFVQTDMGNIAARDIGLEKAFIEVDECIRGLVSIIDEATRERTSGHFLTWDGGEFAW